MKLPEKAQTGLTWRRIRNALKAPSRLLHNVKFWWHDTVSDKEHIFVMGPPRSGTTLVKTVLRTHSNICGVDGETWFFLRKDYAGFRHRAVPNSDMQRFVQESRSITELFDRFAEASKRDQDAAYFLEKTPNTPFGSRISSIIFHDQFLSS
jgi:hypothetical protein